MSTKTTFKRIALVAVAALGLGVLSVAPSSAAAGVPTLTVTTGSASVTTGAANETTTAATVSVVGLLTASTDSYSVQVIKKSEPATASLTFRVAYMETSTAATTRVGQAVNAATGVGLLGANRSTVTAYDSQTATSASSYWLDSQGAGYVGAKFGLMVDSSTATRAVGTYVYTAIVTPYSNGVGGTPVTADLTFTITDTAANIALASGTIDPSKTTAVLNAGASITTTTDSSVAVVATAAQTNHATIQVKTFTSTSLAAPESVTVTLTGGAGVVCNSDGTICGNNLTIAGDGDDLFRVRANGTAGTASIVVKTTTKTFPAKTVAFYAKSPATITVSTNKPVISVLAAASQTDVVRAVALDANGVVWGGQLYVIANAAADALIAGSTTPVACTFDPVNNRHACPVGGIAAGTAALKVMDASLDTDGTIATTDAAVTSATTSTRVSTGSATTATITFDKATYGPGEKATVLVRVLDADGLALPLTTITSAFTAAPTTNVAFSAGSDTLLADVAIAAANSSTSFTTAGARQYTVYMPMSSGTVTITATGSTGLAQAGRVVVTGSAEVVNSSVDAATDAAAITMSASRESDPALNATFVVGAAVKAAVIVDAGNASPSASRARMRTVAFSPGP